ncbi:MAG TPA: isoprenylcysteine carboxylmethyltransferase family protein [Anaerolineales bacterium]|jgi:protein-S-isoprenylcysteine O-methyltransferase Ste14
MTIENKETAGLPLPPPLLMGIFLVVALIFGWALPVPIPSPVWMRVIGMVILFGGFGLAISAVRTMMLSQTSPDPHTPTSAIVTRGPYKFTRNPIYLGFVLIVIGLPLVLGFYWGAILSPIVIDAYNRLIITREEAYLERKFGQQYLEYISRVRRWL